MNSGLSALRGPGMTPEKDLRSLRAGVRANIARRRSAEIGGGRAKARGVPAVSLYRLEPCVDRLVVRYLKIEIAGLDADGAHIRREDEAVDYGREVLALPVGPLVCPDARRLLVDRDRPAFRQLLVGERDAPRRDTCLRSSSASLGDGTRNSSRRR